MRVATYTQPGTVTRGSLAAIAVLVLTILLGTTVLTSLTTQFAPLFTGSLTYLWLGLYLLAFVGLMFTQGINWVSWLVRYRILLVVLLLGAVVSVSWSIDARVSAERTVHLIGTSLIGIYLGFTVPLLTMLRVFGVVLGAVVLASFPAALVLPELGLSEYEGRLVWSGVMSSKNDLGFWAAAGVMLYVSLSDSTRSMPLRLLCYLFAGLCLALLAFSQSATSLLAMLVAGALSLYLFIATRFQLGFARMAVVAALFTAIVAVAVANIDTADLVGRTGDLTGRGEVWRQTWNLIMERPLGGYGYGALWFPSDRTLWIQESLTDFTWIVYHAHNGFLQVASEIGLPLSIVALLMVVQQLIEIFYCQYQRRQPGVLFVLAFVVAYLIGNFSEARFLITREFYWVLFIALPISMLRQVNLVFDDDDAEARQADGGWPGDGGDRAPGTIPPGALVPGAAYAHAGSAGVAQVGAVRAGRESANAPYATGGGAAAHGRPAGALAPSRAGAVGAAGPPPVIDNVLDATMSEGGTAVDGRWVDEWELDGSRSIAFDAADIDLGGHEPSVGRDAPEELDIDGEDRYEKSLDGTGDGTGEWRDEPPAARRRGRVFR